MICNIFSILPFLLFDVLNHKRFLFWQCPIYAQYERERLKSVHFLMYYRSKNVYQGIRSVSCLDPLMVSHPLSMVKVQILNVVVDRGVWFQPAFSLTTPFVMFSSPRLLPKNILVFIFLWCTYDSTPFYLPSPTYPSGSSMNPFSFS